MVRFQKNCHEGFSYERVNVGKLRVQRFAKGCNFNAISKDVKIAILGFAMLDSA